MSNLNEDKREIELKRKLTYAASKIDPSKLIGGMLPMWIIVHELGECLKIAKELTEEDAIAQEQFYGGS